jgi:hypothetical protein
LTAICGGRCNRRAFHRGRTDSGGDTSASFGAILEPEVGRIVKRVQFRAEMACPWNDAVLFARTSYICEFSPPVHGLDGRFGDLRLC